MVIGYPISTNQAVAIGVGAVATGCNSIAIGVNATAGPYRTPVQRLYIDILKHKHRVTKCRRKKNIIEIETERVTADRFDYRPTYKLEPKNDMG